MKCLDFSYISTNQEEISMYRKIIAQLLEENKKLKEEIKLKFPFHDNEMYRF